MCVIYVEYVHFRNILFPVHLFTFMNIDYMCSMYITGGGGRTSTYFPVERLVVDVLSVQCVASTCVSVGMG